MMAFVACALAIASTSLAQDKRVEISGTAGWTMSDGVTRDGVVVPGVGTFDSLEPKDAVSWGGRIGFKVNPNVEVGFLFSQQSTQMEIGGTSTVEVGDVSVRNWHGYFAYNFGENEAPVRPYVLGGFGATEFGGVTARIGNTSKAIDGANKFSTTWAAGLKMLPNEGNFGIRLEARWTPTYIKSDSVGWWCDPYWGCYVLEDPQYANQFEFGGGITLRF